MFFGLQMIRRILEEKFLFISSSATINLIHYAAGFLFYGSFTLLIASYSLLGMNSTQNGAQTQISDFLAVIFFFVGQLIQFNSHKTLAKLRRNMSFRDRQNLGKAYSIPKGGFFELVSCPNYLAECLIYTSIFILSHLEVNMLALEIWVLSNQTLASLLCHAWYKKRFKDYPVNRAAILPFLL